MYASFRHVCCLATFNNLGEYSTFKGVINTMCIYICMYMYVRTYVVSIICSSGVWWWLRNGHCEGRCGSRSSGKHLSLESRWVMEACFSKCHTQTTYVPSGKPMHGIDMQHYPCPKASSCFHYLRVLIMYVCKGQNIGKPLTYFSSVLLIYQECQKV